jgi:hypothetical protein
MIFEIRGIRTATGEKLLARVEASTREHAIERLARRGVAPCAPAKVNISVGEPSRSVSSLRNGAVASNQASDIASHPDSRDAEIAAHPSGNMHSNSLKKCLLAIGAVAVIGLVIAVLVIANSAPSHPIHHAPSILTASNSAAPPSAAPEILPPPVQPLPPNVVRSDNGKFKPAPGYTWKTANAGDFSVRWVSRAPHPDYANISSAQKEGYWAADAGYVFESKDSLRVRWQPGARDPQHANIEAGTAPGKWHPLSGYTWAYPHSPNDYTVIWKPGVAHPTAVNVVSSPDVGVWRPARGYRWVSDTAGDFAVVRAGPSDEQLKSAISMVVIALLSDEIGNRANDGSFSGALVHDFMKGTRNEAIRKALIDLFPNESQLAISAAANIIILGANGELTADNWTSATARDALVARIREKDPLVADAYLLAGFIGNVMETYEQRR